MNMHENINTKKIMDFNVLWQKLDAIVYARFDESFCWVQEDIADHYSIAEHMKYLKAVQTVKWQVVSAVAS